MNDHRSVRLDFGKRVEVCERKKVQDACLEKEVSGNRPAFVFIHLLAGRPQGIVLLALMIQGRLDTRPGWDYVVHQTKRSSVVPEEETTMPYQQLNLFSLGNVEHR